MNFFECQEAARRTSRRLIGLFVLAVAGVVIAVDIGIFMLAAADGSSPGSIAGLIFLSTVVTLAVIGVSSLIRTAGLRSGGGKVAVELGGTRVPEDTSDLHYRRLRNVVEEMSLASGVPVPEIYVLEEEAGINAFAAGWTPATAAVTVTRGALDRLNRDELQGVIAHEYSHILNGDMRLNVRLIGVLFGILVLGIIGRKLLTNMRGSRGKDAVPIWLIALVLLIVGYVGLFFGRLIKAGLSRQREYLADASAVQFTRQTRGIAGALKKIGGLADGSKLAAADAEEASHMFFGDGVGYSELFATHPPLLKRIQALEPGFNGAAMERLSAGWMATPPDGMQEDAALGLTGSVPAPMPAAHVTMAVAAAAVVAQAGTAADRHFDQAAAIHAAIPEALQEAARSLDAAIPLMFALLLDGDAGVRAQQEGIICREHGDATLATASALRTHIDDLHPALRLPLACLAFPVLRRRPRPQLEAFIANVDALADADGQISLFEYCLGCLLHRQLSESLDPSAHFVAGMKKLPDAANAVAMLLAVVAQYGADSPDDARRAYLAGMQEVLPNANIPFVAQDAGAAALDPGWDTLDALDPMAKAALLEGLVATIAADGKITVEESELLRTVCGVLHCPLPPLLGGS
ncbi:MAG: M48 family metallopeptidase [Proteobacteria bacterium]|nr:M48 family metallopeptidase [Pseudomonadota bacterium]MBS0461217.1 M48 family metallopeptidase [Pseudomonadota bacterium]MBS0464643.1 M48 family metallopeptidase [Pseudomonadota bacterium]